MLDHSISRTFRTETQLEQIFRHIPHSPLPILNSLQLRQHHAHDLRRFGRQTSHGLITAQTFEDVLQPFAQRANFRRRVAILLQRLRDLIRLPARLLIALRARDDEVEDVFDGDTPSRSLDPPSPALTLTPLRGARVSRVVEDEILSPLDGEGSG